MIRNLFLPMVGLWMISTVSIAQTRTKMAAPIRCVLEGEVINRPQSNQLLLLKAGDDPHVSAVNIPILNGRFQHTLKCQNNEAYWLIFSDEWTNGQFRPITFFSESGKITFKLNPKDIDFENRIEGGKLNREYKQYQTEQDSLFQFNARRKQETVLKNTDKYFTEFAMNLQKQAEAAKKRKDQQVLDSLRKVFYSGEKEIYTPEAKNLEKEDQEMFLKWKEWKWSYIQTHPSLVGYSLLVDRTKDAIVNNQENIPECINLYKSVFAKKYPSHPYTQKMKIHIKKIESIKVGGSYIDFTAPSFAGNLVKLSTQIKGKVAIIDLWASWCGPCRVRAKSMIPIYEAYKEKGFTIVGVASESNLTDGVNAAKKDKYPWLNLIELKGKNKIWEKYGMQAAGATFLVDKKGIILAIDPTPEEVKAILDKLLN